MTDLTPEQDKLNSARDIAYIAAQTLRMDMDILMRNHVRGEVPDEHTMRAIEEEYAKLADYFALLRRTNA